VKNFIFTGGNGSVGGAGATAGTPGCTTGAEGGVACAPAVFTKPIEAKPTIIMPETKPKLFKNILPSAAALRAQHVIILAAFLNPIPWPITLLSFAVMDHGLIVIHDGGGSASHLCWRCPTHDALLVMGGMYNP
jgi:hypothetical protein